MIETVYVWWVLLFLLWEICWKGIALYKSANNKHKVWFAFLLIVNSVGVLPIVYILFFSEKKSRKKKK